MTIDSLRYHIQSAFLQLLITTCKIHLVNNIQFISPKRLQIFLALINFHSIFPLLNLRCKRMILNKTQHLTEYVTIHIIPFLFQEKPINVKKYVIRLNRNRVLSQQNIQSGSINGILIPHIYACSFNLFPNFLENFPHSVCSLLNQYQWCNCQIMITLHSPALANFQAHPPAKAMK